MGFSRTQARDDMEFPPLWVAVRNGDVIGARALLRGGVQLDSIIEEDPTDSLLHKAAAEGDLDRVNFMLDYPCPVTLETFDFVDRTPLIWASEKGHLEIVERLLEVGANPNSHNEARAGDTALRKAVRGGHHQVVAVLLKAGGDPSIRGWMGLSAIDQAWSSVEGGLNSGAAKKIQALFAAFPDSPNYKAPR
ncbi:MAG: hypothetical protein JWM59_2919 [Verrucomicrobiales bacterium]|nr:hypothetical protein [Verrucomicrobiales bacterium]